MIAKPGVAARDFSLPVGERVLGILAPMSAFGRLILSHFAVQGAVEHLCGGVKDDPVGKDRAGPAPEFSDPGA